MSSTGLGQLRAAGDDRALRRARPRRWLVPALVILAASSVLVLTIPNLILAGHPGDAFTYLAAGERLNAGHDLYALGPGDRPVIMLPPFWSVPLLSPPFIAVLWRPLALIPFDLGPWLWWLGSVACIVGVIVALAIRRPVPTLLAVIVVSFPLAIEFASGNVNGYLLLGSVLVWRWHRREADVLAGFSTSIMAAIKLYPATLGVWLIGQRRPRSVMGLILGGMTALLVSLLGAGLSAHLQYLSIALDKSANGATPASLAGLAQQLGVATGVAAWLPILALVGGSILVLGLARRPDWSFAVAVATMVLGSAVINLNTPVLLLAMLAPLAWPIETEAPRAGSLFDARVDPGRVTPA